MTRSHTSTSLAARKGASPAEVTIPIPQVPLSAGNVSTEIES